MTEERLTVLPNLLDLIKRDFQYDLFPSETGVTGNFSLGNSTPLSRRAVFLKICVLAQSQSLLINRMKNIKMGLRNKIK